MEQLIEKKTNDIIGKKQVADIFFWLGILCELVVSVSGYVFGGYGEPTIIVVGMVFFCVKILLSCNWKQDWLIFLLCGVYGLLCYYFQGSALILRIALILLAGRDIDREKVVKFFFWGTLVIMLVTGVLSALGLHNELYVTALFRNEIETRYCFGFYHPNGFSFFIFRTFMLGIYAYGGNFKWWGIALVAVTMGVFMLLSNSKMGIAITLVSFLAFLFIKYYKGENKEKLFFVLGNIAIILELSLIIIAGIFMKVDTEKMEAEGAWQFLNALTTGRLAYVNKVLHETAPSLFGYKDFMEATEIGFINSLYKEGILFLLLYLFLLFFLFRRMYQEKNILGMLLILGFTGYAFAEAFLPYVNKNGVWLMAIGSGHRWRHKNVEGKNAQEKDYEKKN